MKDSFSGKDPFQIQTRSLVLILLVFLVMIVFLVNLFSLQIINGYIYSSRARDITIRSIPIPSQRGDIYDRNHDTPLVTNVDAYSISVVPAEIPSEERSAVFSRLAAILGKTVEELGELVPPATYGQYQPIEVAPRTGMETVVRIAENLEDFPGVTWGINPIRQYRETGSFVHVLGYIGSITREELQVLYNQGYTAGSLIGKMGIEREYDELLRGREGTHYRTVDVRGRRITEAYQEDVPPVPGNDVVLTLDRDIQRLAERALGERVGSIVVLRPASGDVLAMVSYPSFNANTLYTEEGNNEFARLLQDPQNPFLNRAMMSSYPPASTFKMIMSTAILSEDVFPLERTVTCNGSVRYGDRVFRCWNRTGHGPMDLLHAISNSCDVYFYTVGRDYLGIDRIVHYARNFGLGQVSGIDLPGEVPGLLPTPEWKESRTGTPWLGGDTMNVSIGQGDLLVTPLQMANYVAMVANGGVMYKPHVLLEVLDPVTHETIQRVEPEVIQSLDVPEGVFEEVQRGLRMVVSEGTAQHIMTTRAVASAGKTGTAEFGYTDLWHSWYASYAPYQTSDPSEQVVVIVMVESEIGYWAAQCTNIILQGIFADQDFEEAVRALGWSYLLRTAPPVTNTGTAAGTATTATATPAAETPATIVGGPLF